MKSKRFNEVKDESHYIKADMGNLNGVIEQMSIGKNALVDFTSPNFNPLCYSVSERGLGRRLWICSDKPKEVVDHIKRKKFTGII